MKLRDEFEEWWGSADRTRRHVTNDFDSDTAEYWAYEGWIRGDRSARKRIQEANRLDRKEKRQRYAENKARRSE